MKPFTTRQEKALEALLRNPGVVSAARDCGLSRNTLANYLKNPDFKNELQERKRAQLAEGSATLRAGVKDAAQELLEIVRNKNIAPQIKINAISVLLAYAAKYAELTDIEERLEELASRQDMIEQRQGGGIA